MSALSQNGTYLWRACCPVASVPSLTRQIHGGVLGLTEDAVELMNGLSGKPWGQEFGHAQGSCLPEPESGIVSEVTEEHAVTFPRVVNTGEVDGSYHRAYSGT